MMSRAKRTTNQRQRQRQQQQQQQQQPQQQQQQQQPAPDEWENISFFIETKDMQTLPWCDDIENGNNANKQQQQQQQQQRQRRNRRFVLLFTPCGEKICYK